MKDLKKKKKKEMKDLYRQGSRNKEAVLGQKLGWFVVRFLSFREAGSITKMILLMLIRHS